jgi:hypothetical protein
MQTLSEQYIAGFFDGEGSIYLSKDASGYYRLNACITNACREILEIIQKMYGGYIRIKSPSSMGKKRVYELILTNKLAEVFLKDILPYLVIKKEIAEKALQYRKTILNNFYRKNGVPSELLQRREVLKQEIFTLNEAA